MRGGASCSVERARNARGTMPLPALPPRRLPSAAAEASQQHAMFAPNMPNRSARTGGQTAPTWISPGPILCPRGLRPGACPRVDGTLPVPPPPKQTPRRAPVGSARHRPPVARAQVGPGPTARDPCRSGASQRGCCCAARPAHIDSPAVAPEAAGTISIA